MSEQRHNAELLNTLVEMQDSVAYALRKGVLQQAESVICNKEDELTALSTKNTELQRQLDSIVVTDNTAVIAELHRRLSEKDKYLADTLRKLENVVINTKSISSVINYLKEIK